MKEWQTPLGFLEHKSCSGKSSQGVIAGGAGGTCSISCADSGARSQNVEPISQMFISLPLGSQLGPGLLRGENGNCVTQKLLGALRATSVFTSVCYNFRKHVFTGIKSTNNNMVVGVMSPLINCFIQLMI